LNLSGFWISGFWVSGFWPVGILSFGILDGTHKFDVVQINFHPDLLRHY
jgi:hypothetical protein